MKNYLCFIFLFLQLEFIFAYDFHWDGENSIEGLAELQRSLSKKGMELHLTNEAKAEFSSIFDSAKKIELKGASEAEFLARLRLAALSYSFEISGGEVLTISRPKDRASLLIYVSDQFIKLFDQSEKEIESYMNSINIPFVEGDLVCIKEAAVGFKIEFVSFEDNFETIRAIVKLLESGVRVGAKEIKK